MLALNIFFLIMNISYEELKIEYKILMISHFEKRMDYVPFYFEMYLKSEMKHS